MCIRPVEIVQGERRVSDANFRIIKGHDANVTLLFIIDGISDLFEVSLLHGFVHQVILVHHIGNIYT